MAALRLPLRRLVHRANYRSFSGLADPLTALYSAQSSSVLAPATQGLLEGLLRGDRVCLARAITLGKLDSWK